MNIWRTISDSRNIVINQECANPVFLKPENLSGSTLSMLLIYKHVRLNAAVKKHSFRVFLSSSIP